MSATARVPLPLKLAGQQGLGWHGVFPYQMPLQALGEVMVQKMVPATQQAPRLGGQLVTEQGTPAPSQASPWASHWAWVVIRQLPVSRLQHPPRRQGFGLQGTPRNQWPLQADALEINVHAPSIVQHAPMAGHGLGLQVVLANQWPQQQASVVMVHEPAGTAGHAGVAGHGKFASVQQAPSAGQSEEVQAWLGNHSQLAVNAAVAVVRVLLHCDCGTTWQAWPGQQHAPVIGGQGLGLHVTPGKNWLPVGHCEARTKMHPPAAVELAMMQQAPRTCGQGLGLHGVFGIQTPWSASQSDLRVSTHWSVAPWRMQQAPFGHGLVAQVPPGVKMLPGAGQLAGVLL